MDELSALKRSLKERQRELDALAEKYNNARRAQEKRAKEQYEKLLREVRDDAEARGNELNRKYGERMQEYEAQVQFEQQMAKLQMEDSYKKLSEDVRQAKKQWDAALEEMEALAKELQRDLDSRELVSNIEAGKLINDARQVYAEVDAMPHEFFLPNRLGLFGGAIGDAERLRGAGMHQASAAVSISAKSGITKLGYDVSDLRGEWETAFELLSARTDGLTIHLDEAVDCWLKTYMDEGERGEKGRALAAAELNFWSRGVFAEIGGEGRQYKDRVEAAKKDLQAYLTGSDVWTLDELKEAIARVSAMDGGLSAACAIAGKRYDASCRRYGWGEAIIKYLREQVNLELLEAGYKLADGKTLAQTCFTEYVKRVLCDESIKEDYREWFEIVFKNNEGTILSVYIIPQEDPSSLDVTNRVFMHVDFVGAADGAFSRDMRNYILSVLEAEGAAETEVFLPENLEAVQPDSVYFEAGQKLIHQKGERAKH